MSFIFIFCLRSFRVKTKKNEKELKYGVRSTFMFRCNTNSHRLITDLPETVKTETVSELLC